MKYLFLSLAILALSFGTVACGDDDSGGGDTKSSFQADATSGASGDKTGVAGSFALNISDTHSEAVIDPTAIVNARGGTVSLTAGNNSEATVEAKAKAAVHICAIILAN